MKCAKAMLLFLGSLSSISLAQQVPAFPPPGSQVTAPAPQTATQATPQTQVNTQQQAPTQPAAAGAQPQTTAQPAQASPQPLAAQPAASSPEPVAQQPASTTPQQQAPATPAAASTQTQPVAQQPATTTPGQAPTQPAAAESQQGATQPAPTTTEPQASPTEPSIQQQQHQSSQGQLSLPESDREELARIQAEQARIDERRQLIDLRKKSEQRLRESRAVLKELLGSKAVVANSMIKQSRCVVIVPALKKGAIGFGAKYGRGVMSCRLGQDFQGPWSPPSMYAMEGANFGLQFGLQGTDLVLLIMNDRGADSLLSSKFKLGGDASLAAGPFGRNMEASTDAAMRAKILAFSKAHGIFAGVALDGSTVRPDNQANLALYGRRLNVRQIVREGEVRVPHDAAPLIHLLEESAPVASAGNQQNGQH